jgi:hypothetical protein
MVLITPLPAPMRRPMGPLMLSVQPGKGSFQMGMTGVEKFDCGTSAEEETY